MTSIVKLEALSGVQDDGPLCYLLQVDDAYFLLDCGWDERFDMAYIEAVKRRVPKINAVLLSYGDIPHAGALPYLVAKCGLKCPVYATVPVCKMAQMFLYDWVQGHLSAEDFSHFNFDDIDQAMRYVQQVKYTQTILLKGDNGLQITPYPAGHMMGGAIWKITKMGDEEIVYAVDFNHKKERHLNGCTFDGIGRPNLLITDAFNAMYTQKRRKTRDEILLTKLLNTVRNGGDVMLVIDTAGRMLELAHLLDQLWQNVEAGLMAYNLVMLSSVASSVVEYAKSLIEWMSDKIQKNFEVQRTNPFQFRHVQLCHNKNDLYRVRSPKVVLVSGLDMESGLSRDLFLDWCANSKNTIIVSGRSGDRTLGSKLIRLAEARDADRPMSNIIRLEVKRRVLLDGAELEAWIRRKKDEEQEAIRQRLEAARRNARLEYAAESDDSDDEDTLAAVCEAAATGANNYRKLGPNKNEYNKRSVKSSILWTYEPQQKSSFFKQNKRSFPMFPHHEHRIKMDAYGEIIRPDDYTVNDGIVPDIEAIAQEAQPEEHEEKMEVEVKPMSKPLERPTKCVTSKTKVEVLCKVEYIDFEGRSDGESIKRFLSQIKPKQLILVHGSPESTRYLADHVKENELIQGSVFTPSLGEVVDATIESHILQVVLNEQLMSSLSFQKVKDAEMAWIDARVLRKIENNQIVFEPLVGEKMKALESSEAAETVEEPEKMEVDDEVDQEEVAPVQRRVEENTVVEKLYLEMLPVSEIPPHQAVFVNDPKLSDMKHFFVQEGFQAEFSCGVLYVNNIVSIRRNEAGKFHVEGCLCEDYFRVRDIVYNQFAIV
uniref:Cleavage and polyadenylation specificity factor subunit 2 n=1 Tax=Steinernema glaseri TaxID=37863 RepID=A0A1I8ANQ7_9BILA